MFRYGLKIWSRNKDLFLPAHQAIRRGTIDFVELYNDPTVTFDATTFEPLISLPITIHNSHQGSWHEFILSDDLMVYWRTTLALADFFKSEKIIVHIGREITLEKFLLEMKKIDDPRILIENSAGCDILDRPMFGQRLLDLKEIRKSKPICFDFEKAVKAAIYQGLDYKSYILECITSLQPTYFHISGGSLDYARDEHLNLWDCSIDWKWLKSVLTKYGSKKVLQIAFEVPKTTGIENDLKNMDFWRLL